MRRFGNKDFRNKNPFKKRRQFPRKKFHKNHAKNSKQAYRTGLKGQEIIQEILPRLKFIGIQGADFVLERGVKPPLFFEVKTNFNNFHTAGKDYSNHILLKIRGGEWVNNKAHYVIFVTHKGLFIGRASDLRSFVKSYSEKMPVIQTVDKSGLSRRIVSIAELLKNRYLTPFPNNKKGAEKVFRRFMDNENQRKANQEKERLALERKVLSMMGRRPAKNPAFRGVSTRNNVFNGARKPMKLPVSVRSINRGKAKR